MQMSVQGSISTGQGISGQVNFGGAASGSDRSSMLSSSVTSNLAGMPMALSASSNNTPPPYEAGPHMSSFGGAHPISSMSGDGVSGQYSEQATSGQPQSIPSGVQTQGSNVRPAPNLEAARYVWSIRISKCMERDTM